VQKARALFRELANSQLSKGVSSRRRLAVFVLRRSMFLKGGIETMVTEISIFMQTHSDGLANCSRTQANASPGVPIRNPLRRDTSGSSMKCFVFNVARKSTLARVATIRIGTSAGWLI
jgi:hypothetical protein